MQGLRQQNAGLQDRFDWRSVAASGMAAGVGYAVGQALNGTELSAIAQKMVRGAIAGSVSTLVRGGKLSFAQLAQDAFGQVSAVDFAHESLASSGEDSDDGPGLLPEPGTGDFSRMDGQGYRSLPYNSSASIAQAALGQMVGVFGTPSPYAISNGVSSEALFAQAATLPGQPIVVSDAGGGRTPRLPAGIRNPDATDPFEKFDLDTQAGRDLFFRQTKADFDNGALPAQQASAAKAMLFHYYGYAMGENLGGNSAALAGTVVSTGSDDAALGRALNAYADAEAAEADKRFKFYSEIGVVYDAKGAATRARTLNVTKDGRTVTLNWKADFSTWAGHVGVSADEALRKTNFSVYEAIQNAAFKTEGLESLSMNGAWRPAFVDYVAIYDAQRQDPNADRANLAAMKAVIDARPKGADGQPKPWSIVHVDSRGIDINAINGVAVRNTAYSNGVPKNAEPPIISAFTDNLLNESGTRQIFQPWRMWTNVPSYLANPSLSLNSIVNHGGTENEKLHNNHIHYGR